LWLPEYFIVKKTKLINVKCLFPIQTRSLMVKPRGHFNQPALWSSLMVILATKHHQLITCLFVRPGQKDITVIGRNHTKSSHSPVAGNWWGQFNNGPCSISYRSGFRRCPAATVTFVMTLLDLSACPPPHRLTQTRK